jgi:hypothetical protein
MSYLEGLGILLSFQQFILVSGDVNSCGMDLFPFLSVVVKKKIKNKKFMCIKILLYVLPLPF